VSVENVQAGSVAQLGYLAFEVSDLATWEAFSQRVLGLEIGRRGPDGAFTLRMDGHAARFFITPGPANDLVCLGWEAADDASLDATLARLRAANVAVREATEEERAHRQVRRLYAFQDPAGIPSELYVGPALVETPFKSPVVRSGFRADEQGLGHAVIYANTKEESTRFYCDVLGFRLSDHIVCDIHGFHVDISFFHANARHHSVAFGEKQKKRLHHFMLEVRSMDDVGLAYDRALKSGVRIMQTLGKHPNDGMFSFYARTPSGFQFEFGWGGRQVDDASWVPTTYDHISEWGHHPPEALAPPAPRRHDPEETAHGSSGTGR
jgi:2,3-dihydroxybiphenyl 1,2-dioxygenase